MNKKGGITPAGCLLAIIIAIVIIAAGFFAYRTFMNNVNNVVDEALSGDELASLIHEIAESYGYDITEEQVQEIIDNIPEEKIERVREIAKKHITPEMIAKVSELAESGDQEAVQEYLMKELDYTELQDLYEIYEDYVQGH